MHRPPSRPVTLAGLAALVALSASSSRPAAQAAPTAAPATAQAAAPARKPPASAAVKPAATASSTVSAPQTREAAIANLMFRQIGPAVMGGRIDDLAVVESDPSVVYAGAASGGVWKTTNRGTTWTPVFDKESVSTIGDVTLAPSDPSVVWVGTGEANNRQSSSWGNGVYRSTDGGQTWKHKGLRETQTISRILVHPTNPEVVYVAALGRLWGPNKERGVFKTVNGGESWTQVLFVNEDTGITDLAMAPGSPDTLLAAAYQRRRTVFGFAGSGPDGGIYKTTDGGANWKKLVAGLPWDPSPPRPRATQGDGMPAAVAGTLGATPAAPAAAAAKPEDRDARQEIGRIGLNFHRRNADIVYALVEHANGGLFRSDDRGETWQKMSDTNPRPMYYSKVHLDPNNDQRVWVLGAPLYYSEDGGRTFTTEFAQKVHSDHHALWINPANSDEMILGGDGGISTSQDRGRTWDFVNNIAIGQFYEIGVDMQQPYRICGGLQDNNAWCGPSMSMNPRGIGNADWFTIGGGDGFYAQVDPTDPNTVYTESQDGNVLRRDLRTGEQRSIRPQPAEGERPYRFQWNSPIVTSAHDPRTIYYAGNFVFRSNDRGDSWSKVSPDITTGADRLAMPIMGRAPDKQTRSRHDGVRHWPAATTLSESPLTASVLWVGTDDGMLHVTRDGGKTWKNVFERVTGVPRGTYVSRVVASRHAEGTAYVTFDGHRSNDFGIYVYATADYGETWKKITAGLPDDHGTINVIREHPRKADLLFAGGEYGAFVSFTRGTSWAPLKLNLPTVPVDDILIHPRDNDLILGTHGRSIWVLDDVTPLVELDEKVLASDLHVFSTRPAVQFRQWANSGSTGDREFFGANPPVGAILHYYLKAKPADGDQVRVVVQDKSGKTVRTISNGPKEAGVNRVAWDTRMDPPVAPPQPGSGGTGGGGGGFGGFGAGGPRVDPGEYTFKVSVGTLEASGTVTVQEDPRVTMSDVDRAARWAVLNKLMPKMRPVILAQRTIQPMRTAVANQIEAWKRPGAAAPPGHVTQAAETLLANIDAAYPNFGTPPSEALGLGDAGPPMVERPAPYPQRMQQLFAAISNQSAAPTAWQVQQVELVTGKADEVAGSVKKLQDELAALNTLMNEAGVPHITVPQGGGGRGSGRPE
jgi:photosystem II stability/assembly factor-like uncharacterized protein